jgi:hypothetical protein
VAFFLPLLLLRLQTATMSVTFVHQRSAISYFSLIVCCWFAFSRLIFAQNKIKTKNVTHADHPAAMFLGEVSNRIGRSASSQIASVTFEGKNQHDGN